MKFSSFLAWSKLKKEVLNPWTPQTSSLLKKNIELNEYMMRKTYTPQEVSRINPQKNLKSHQKKTTRFSQRSVNIEKSDFFGFFFYLIY